MDHKDLVRSHYDAHVDPNVSTREALQKRRQGDSFPLKRFHNEIKKNLLNRFVVPGGTLLDLCCGRGGDIHKWKDAKVKRVLGVDLSPNEIDEARRRYVELQHAQQRQSRGPLNLDVQFDVCDTLGEKEYIAPGGPYDTVTCMFALHYFFISEKQLRMFLRNVSINLKPGGHFIATIPDGKRVLWHLGGRDVFDSPFLRLEKKWEGQEHTRQPFNNGYLWSLHDTVTAGTGQSEGSIEFLTFTQPILRIAAHYDMEPVIDYGNEALTRCFEIEDTEYPFKHFFPQFQDASDPSLMVASSIFMAVVFRKLGPEEAPPAINPPLLKTLPPREEWPPFPEGDGPQEGDPAGYEGYGEGEGQGDAADNNDAEDDTGGYMVSAYADNEEGEDPGQGDPGQEDPYGRDEDDAAGAARAASLDPTGPGGPRPVLDYGDEEEEEKPVKRMRAE